LTRPEFSGIHWHIPPETQEEFQPENIVIKR
jgi:hypothetical protein